MCVLVGGVFIFLLLTKYVIYDHLLSKKYMVI